MTAVKKNMAKVQNEVSKVNFKEVEKQSEKARKIIKDTFDPNDISGIKINGEPFNIKNIKGYSKEVQKLKGEVGLLDKFKNTDKSLTNSKNLTTDKLNTQSNSKKTITGYRTDWQKTDLSPSESSFSFWDKLKEKISQVKLHIEKFKTSFKSDKTDEQKAEISPSESSFSLWDKLKEKISQMKSNIEKFKASLNSNNSSEKIDLPNYQTNESGKNLQNHSKLNIDTKDIIKTKADLKELKAYQENIENSSGNSSTFLNWLTAMQKITTSISGVISKVNILNTRFNGLSGISTKIKNSIKQIANGFKNVLGSALKHIKDLFGLENIYQVLKNAASNWLSSQNGDAQQLSTNIEYMKYAMGSVFISVIETAINLVYKLMKAIQSVAFAFTGINIFAKATTKSMNKTALSATKTSKALAGIHGEISNISSNDDSGSEGENIVPSIDLSEVDSEMSIFSQKLYDFFVPLKQSWDNYGNNIINQLKTTVSQVTELIGSIWGSFEKVIVNGTVYKTLELFLAIIGNIAQASENAWNTDKIGDRLVQNIFNTLNNILKIINQISQSQGMQNLFNSVLDTLNYITEIIDNIANNFQNAWNYNGNGDRILTNIGQTFENIFNAIEKITRSEDFQEFLNNMFDKFGKISETLSQINWEPLIQALTSIGENIGNIALNILSGVVEIFKWLVENPIVAEIIMAIAIAIGVISTILGALIPIITTFSAGLSLMSVAIVAIIAIVSAVILAIMNWGTIVEWIKEKLGPLGNVISEVFGMIWDVISTVLGFVWNIISTVFNAIWNIISPILNAIWNTVSVVFTAIWNIISPILNMIWSVIKTVLGEIETIWSNVWNTISNIVTNIWNGIWNTIKNVINFILGGIEGMANGIVRGINVVIGALNKIKIDIPDWVPGLGGKTFGFNLKTISEVSLPRLARGTVAYEETLGIFGEYSNVKNNPEIVTPQNIMKETFRGELQEFANKQSSNSGLEKLIIQFGSAQVALELEKLIKQARRQNGIAIAEI